MILGGEAEGRDRVFFCFFYFRVETIYAFLFFVSFELELNTVFGGHY